MARTREDEDRRLVLAVARRVTAGGVPAKGFSVRSDAADHRFICPECEIDKRDTLRVLGEQGWFGRVKVAVQFDNTTLHPVEAHGAVPPAALVEQVRALLARFPGYLNPEGDVD